MQLSTADRTLDDTALPTIMELEQIEPGSFCRLQTKGGTRFWVRVVGIRSNGVIDGLAEDGIKSIDMKREQLVVFDRAHVFEVA